MMANLEPTAECHGHWLKVLAEPSGGKFTVTNSWNNFSKRTKKRGPLDVTVSKGVYFVARQVVTDQV
jgi:hypothetical protein